MNFWPGGRKDFTPVGKYISCAKNVIISEKTDPEMIISVLKYLMTISAKHAMF